ncbi:MAG: hypothetical protein AAF665_16075 [Pseudomonadota bacterium]
MLELVREIANTWVTWWMVGLLLSFRMIVPARNFLSERSAQWLAHNLTDARSTSVRRRFDVSFKRYVDKTFGARQVRIGGCRLWVLRYRKTALISLLTYLLIYCAVLTTLDFDLIYAGMEDMRANFRDPNHPDFNAQVAGFADLVDDLDTFVLVAALLMLNGILLGLFNTITDFVSFLETRNILARLGRGPARDIFWVLVDLVLTTLISIGGFVLFWVCTTYFGTLFSERSLPIGDVAYQGMMLGISALTRAVEMLGPEQPALIITDPAMISMTFSTYATSIWIWVFFLSTLAIRSAVLFAPLLRAVTFLVDVEDHPFRAAWLMFAIVWSLSVAGFALT